MDREDHTQRNLDARLSSQHVLKSSLSFGACTGSLAFCSALTFGILRSANPLIFGLAHGINYFGMGTIFWATRTIYISSSNQQSSYWPSAAGGALSGAVMAGLTRSSRQIAPQAIFWSLTGLGGQYVYESLDESHTTTINAALEEQGRKETFLERVASSRWSPVQVLDDASYEKMLKEKLIRVEADIAILDEDIEKLKSQQRKDESISCR